MNNFKLKSDIIKIEMTQDNFRFSNILGDDYDLSVMSYPHHDEFQKTIGDVIAKKFKDSSITEIELLEIGCGTGITSKFLLSSDSRIKITGIDNEPKMITQIGTNIKKWNMESRMKVVQSDILEYLNMKAENSFDVVASGFTIHNFDQAIKEKIILQIFRILKHDGLFVNGDKYAHDDISIHNEIVKKQRARYDIFEKIGRPDYKQAMISHMDRDEKEDLIFKEDEAKKMMEKIGFKEVQTNWRIDMEAIISGVKK